MDGLVTWLKGLVFLVLFASFMELILPHSSMNRFIRFIVGLFIMLAVLQPFLASFEKLKNPDAVNAMTHSFQQLNQTDNTAWNLPEPKQPELAQKLYEQELAQQIRGFVRQIDGVQDAEVLVTASHNVKQPGKIERLVIKLREQSLVRPVDPVQFGAKDQQDASASALAAKVVHSVSEIYQISPQNIEVHSLG